MWISVSFTWFSLPQNTRNGIGVLSIPCWGCSGASLFCDFRPLSPRNFPHYPPNSQFFQHPSPQPQLHDPHFIVQDNVSFLSLLDLMDLLFTLKTLLTGGYIIYHPNYDSCESERGPNNNFAGTTDVHQESPQKNRAHDHYTSPLKQKLSTPELALYQCRKGGRGLKIVRLPFSLLLPSPVPISGWSHKVYFSYRYELCHLP